MRLFAKRKYRPGVFMVTYSLTGGKPKYLVLKRKLHWKGFEFPKGGIEGKESKFEAIKREILEETGLSIKKIKNHHKTGKWVYLEGLKDRSEFIGQKWSLFSVEVLSGKVSLDKHEHSGFEWMSFEEALEKLSYEDQKDCLEIVESWLKKAK